MAGVSMGATGEYQPNNLPTELALSRAQESITKGVPALGAGSSARRFLHGMEI